MIRAFSGDAFLARRAFLEAVQSATVAGAELVRIGEDLDAALLQQALGQGGLFGAPVLALDLEAAFAGQGAAATAERNAVLDALEAAGAADVLVYDPGATPTRQKRWRSLGHLDHLPTPRYGNLVRWVRAELESAGIRSRGDVAARFADLFGDDLPGIVAEIDKLRVLDDELTPDRLTELVQRPAARSAFQLIDAVMAGDPRLAVEVLDTLLQSGEAPVKVMAALSWQVDLVAGCVALRSEEPDIDQGRAASQLKANPYPTGKALAIAARLDERSLTDLVERVVAADQAMKSGADPIWQLQACVLGSARQMAVLTRSRARRR